MLQDEEKNRSELMQYERMRLEPRRGYCFAVGYFPRNICIGYVYVSLSRAV